MKKKIGILTGGGDCPGLNPAIRGCVYAAEKYGYECVGITDGWKGLVEGTTIPLSTVKGQPDTIDVMRLRKYVSALIARPEYVPWPGYSRFAHDVIPDKFKQ